MRHLKLTTIRVVYSVSLIVLMTTMGVLFVQEVLNWYEVLGLVLAVVSLVFTDTLRVSGWDVGARPSFVTCRHVSVK